MRGCYFKWISLLFCIFFASSALADDLHFEGDYVFAWNGIRIGKLHLQMQQNQADYNVRSQLKTSGIVALFSDHKSLTTVKGKAEGARFQPVAYRSNYHSGNKDKLIDLQYDESGKVIAEDIKPSRGARPEVPEDLKTGAADSLTAIFAMRAQVKEALATGAEEIIVPVFDGVRRFNLHARMITPENSIVLEGQSVPAVKLGLSRKPLAGFKDKELKKIAEGEPELEFFVDRKHFTLLGFQLPLYGGTVNAWVKNACFDDACQNNTKQVAVK